MLDGVYQLTALPFILLCLVCTIWGAAQTMQHHRLLIGISVLIIGYVAFQWIYESLLHDVIRYVEQAVTQILTTIHSESVDSRLHFKVYFTVKVMYVLCLGGLYYFVGVILFKKFSSI